MAANRPAPRPGLWRLRVKRLKLPRTLANTLLADLQFGVGEGLIGAIADVPVSV